MAVTSALGSSAASTVLRVSVKSNSVLAHGQCQCHCASSVVLKSALSTTATVTTPGFKCAPLLSWSHKSSSSMDAGRLSVSCAASQVCNSSHSSLPQFSVSIATPRGSQTWILTHNTNGLLLFLNAMPAIPPIPFVFVLVHSVGLL